MKQVLQNYKTGELKVHDIPAPVASAGRILVANHFSLISAGTERSTVSMAKKNLAGKAMERPDLVKKVIDKVKKDGLADTLKMVGGRLDSLAALGYSSAGVVIEVGHGVRGFSVGDMVACAGQNYASHAEIVQVPVNLCTKVPEGVSLRDASYVAVGAIAMQGLRQAEPQLGETVAVIGLGLIGLILVQMLKANGCRVIAMDLDPGKLELAAKLGADRAVPPSEFYKVCESESHGYGVDAVVVVASTKSDQPVIDAAEVCRKKGRVVVLGAVGMNLPREPYYLKELDFKLSMSYGPGRYDPLYEESGHDYPQAYVRWTEGRNMQAFLDLLKGKSICLDEISTHSFEIDHAEKAYQLISENSEPYLGITLSYPAHSDVPSRRVSISNKPNNDSHVGISVVGTGNHVKDMLLPHLTAGNGYCLRGLCSERGISAKQVAEKRQAAFVTSSIDEIYSDSDTDAVLIGTRHDTHAKMALDALRSGKHVFVEKPLALSDDELNPIVEFYRENAGVDDLPMLMLGFNRRYSKHADEIKCFFKDRVAPLVLSYRVNAGQIDASHWIQNLDIGGGRIVGEACHFIDLMQYITGSRVVKVYAASISRHPTGITEDQAILTLSFSDGSVGSLVYASGGDKSLEKEYMEIIGDGKVAVMEDFYKTTFYANSKPRVFKTKNRDKGFQAELAAFAKAIQGGEWSLDSLVSDLATTKATFAARQSMQTGEAVSVNIDI